MAVTVEEAQEALAALAVELGGIESRLVAILEGLPPSPQEDAMYEHEMPYDVTTEILAVIECLLDDEIRPARAELVEVAAVTDEQLLDRWREEQI